MILSQTNRIKSLKQLQHPMGRESTRGRKKQDHVDDSSEVGHFVLLGTLDQEKQMKFINHHGSGQFSISLQEIIG